MLDHETILPVTMHVCLCLTILKRRSFGKAEKVRATDGGESHAAVGHGLDVREDVIGRHALRAEGGQGGDCGGEGRGDVTVVHRGLVDEELLP